MILINKSKAIAFIIFSVLLYIGTFLQNCLWGLFGLAPSQSYILLFIMFNMFSIIIFTLRFPKKRIIWPTILALPIFIWFLISLNDQRLEGINKKIILNILIITAFYLTMTLSVIIKRYINKIKYSKHISKTDI
jgi:hypothetical protein